MMGRPYNMRTAGMIRNKAKALRQAYIRAKMLSLGVVHQTMR